MSYTGCWQLNANNRSFPSALAYNNLLRDYDGNQLIVRENNQDGKFPIISAIQYFYLCSEHLDGQQSRYGFRYSDQFSRIRTGEDIRLTYVGGWLSCTLHCGSQGTVVCWLTSSHIDALYSHTLEKVNHERNLSIVAVATALFCVSTALKKSKQRLIMIHVVRFLFSMTLGSCSVRSKGRLIWILERGTVRYIAAALCESQPESAISRFLLLVPVIGQFSMPVSSHLSGPPKRRIVVLASLRLRSFCFIASWFNVSAALIVNYSNGGTYWDCPSGVIALLSNHLRRCFVASRHESSLLFTVSDILPVPARVRQMVYQVYFLEVMPNFKFNGSAAMFSWKTMAASTGIMC